MARVASATSRRPAWIVGARLEASVTKATDADELKDESKRQICDCHGFFPAVRCDHRYYT
jgi:hypothetical protein